MTTTAATLTLWHWWLAAGVLLLVELFAPGFVFLWIALAAFATGVVVWMLPELAWQMQLLAFAVLCVVSVVAWMRLRPDVDHDDAAASLNQRGRELIGRRLVLSEPIAQGRGRARVDDGSWPVSGPDLEQGAIVEVVDLDGTRLVVRPIPADPPDADAATGPTGGAQEPHVGPEEADSAPEIGRDTDPPLGSGDTGRPVSGDRRG